MASLTASDQFGEYDRQRVRVQVLAAQVAGRGAVLSVTSEDGTHFRLEMDRSQGLTLADEVSRECGV